VIGKVKEGTNDPELQAEGEAIDRPFRASLPGLSAGTAEQEAELKDEKEEGGVKPRES